MVIGRTMTTLPALMQDDRLSRRHARIARSADGRLVVVDLDSRNGTFVDGERIVEPTPIRAGSEVRVGRTAFMVVEVGDRGTVRRERTGATEKLDVAPRPHAVEPAPRQPPPNEAQAPPRAASARPPAPPGAPRERVTGPATVLHAERRIPIAVPGLAIGRAPDNDVVLANDRVSRHHTRVDLDERGYYVTDLASRNGTYLNGERLRSEGRWLASGDTVTVGGERVRFLRGEATRPGYNRPPSLVGTQSVHFEGERLTLGRDPANDVVLEDPNVSRFHAEIVAGAEGLELRDLGARNGTRLDGALVDRAPLKRGAEIGIGPFRLVCDGRSFVARDDRGALRLDANEVVVRVSGKEILHRSSFSVEPGEFVAIIGESGSGKTTLIKTLAGVMRPTQGVVTVNGEPVAVRLPEIGYVPQDEIVHPKLTVREALRYAARLRLPPDSRRAELDEAVGRVLDELALVEHAETRVESLSGGQRKRAGVGTELVNRPGLLFLDEATTGLDPGLERRMMQLMRDLANNGRAVITITHATKNLMLCDKVAVMGRGGSLCFFGPPREALEFFRTDEYDGIYLALEETPADEWRRQWEQLGEGALVGEDATSKEQVEPPARIERPNAGREVLPQARILASRYGRILLRDRRNLAILLGQVPLLAFAIAGLFPANVLETQSLRPNKVAQLLFLLVTVAIWFGSIAAAREIVKERATFTRETAVGVRIVAYLLSKATLLFALVALQTVALCLIVFALRPGGGNATVLIVAVVTGWVGVGLGVLISALVNSENQAMSFLPLALIPQLLFAGQIVPVPDMSAPVKALSTLVFARWSFEGFGAAAHLRTRFLASPHTIRTNIFGDSFFALSPVTALLVLGGFLTVLLGAVAWRLRGRPG